MGMHINRAKMKVGMDKILYFGYDIFPGSLSLHNYISEQRKKFLR